MAQGLEGRLPSQGLCHFLKEIAELLLKETEFVALCFRRNKNELLDMQIWAPQLIGWKRAILLS